MSEKLVTDFKAALRVGTPLVGITTPDPGATIDLLAEAVGDIRAVLVWDTIHGLRAYPGKKEHEDARREFALPSPADLNGVEVLVSAESKMPAKCVLFLMNAHLLIKNSDHPLAIIQAIWNLRDAFKKNKRMLVLLGAMMSLPKELEHDVVSFDEELPTADKLKAIVLKQHENAGLTIPTGDVLGHAVDALAGLSHFPAEQVVAMSLTKDGIALDSLWERKRKMIEQTPGLSVWRGGETFDTIGGYDNVKHFIGRLVEGPNAPAGIVFIDEIEKMLAGARGDNTGVSQGQHQALLAFMQDTKARGLLFVGHPGSGKSAIAKATGNTAGVPTIQFDLGGMKAGIVGESEAMTRNALKVVQAVCQGRALFVATCNSLNGLSPELRRRFRNGTFFFDLPVKAERESIWKIYETRYKLDTKKNKRPNDVGWTGAEIENCCDQAFSIGGSLIEAAQFIVPQAVAMGDQVRNRRKEANGSIISASYPGAYDMERGDVGSAIAERMGSADRRIDISEAR